MAKRIYNELKRNGIETELANIETILNGNGTNADGDIYDIIETLTCYCEMTDETADIINELTIM